MAQYDWRVSLDEPAFDDPEGPLLHEAVPDDDSLQLEAEFALDWPTLASPRDLTRVLYFTAGYSYKEIAEVEGVSRDAVKMSVYRARLAIRRHLLCTGQCEISETDMVTPCYFCGFCRSNSCTRLK